jgi:hypothetical protein
MNLIDMKKRFKHTNKLSILILNLNMLLVTKDKSFMNLIDMKKRLKHTIKLSKLILNINMLFIIKEMC